MLGALTLAAMVSGLFFLRFYVVTRDRLFLGFAVAFWLLGVQWLLLGALDLERDNQPFLYVIRLAAFLTMILAIVDKNRGGRR